MWFSGQLMATFIRMSACSWAIHIGKNRDPWALPETLMGLLGIINTFTIFHHINENKDRQGDIFADTLDSGQEKETRNTAWITRGFTPMLPIISVPTWLSAGQRQFPRLLHEHNKVQLFCVPHKTFKHYSWPLRKSSITTRGIGITHAFAICKKIQSGLFGNGADHVTWLEGYSYQGHTTWDSNLLSPLWPISWPPLLRWQPWIAVQEQGSKVNFYTGQWVSICSCKVVLYRA